MRYINLLFTYLLTYLQCRVNTDHQPEPLRLSFQPGRPRRMFATKSETQSLQQRQQRMKNFSQWDHLRRRRPTAATSTPSAGSCRRTGQSGAGNTARKFRRCPPRRTRATSGRRRRTTRPTMTTAETYQQHRFHYYHHSPSPSALMTPMTTAQHIRCTTRHMLQMHWRCVTHRAGAQPRPQARPASTDFDLQSNSHKPESIG